MTSEQFESRSGEVIRMFGGNYRRVAGPGIDGDYQAAVHFGLNRDGLHEYVLHVANTDPEGIILGEQRFPAPNGAVIHGEKELRVSGINIPAFQGLGVLVVAYAK